MNNLIQHAEKAKNNNEDLTFDMDMLQLQLGERICEKKKKHLSGPWSERTAYGRDEAGKQAQAGPALRHCQTQQPQV